MAAQRLAAIALCALACACSKPQGDGHRNRGMPEVGFRVMQPTSAAIVTELPARINALRTAEVRPQISGVILRRLYAEGALVHQGQPLYQIDPSLYRAAAAQAQANLASAQASAEAAQARANRFKPLAAEQAIAQQDYTDAAAQARAANAAVAQTRAALNTAQINLRFTTVPAPITGRIGRSLFTEGALVTSNQADPLAVISQLDPIFADIQQSSAEILALRRQLAKGGALPANAGVRLQLEDGSDYGFAGTIQFSEVTVNEATGTVTLRATFPNPQGTLLPGMFVKARFEQGVENDAFLVPQQALQRDLGGEAFVYLVGKDGKVEKRTVMTARTLGENWVVSAGLRAGDKVISQGTANLRPGMKVRAVPESAPQTVRPRKPGEGGGANPGAARPGGN